MSLFPYPPAAVRDNSTGPKVGWVLMGRHAIREVSWKRRSSDAHWNRWGILAAEQSQTAPNREQRSDVRAEYVGDAGQWAAVFQHLK